MGGSETEPPISLRLPPSRNPKDGLRPAQEITASAGPPFLCSFLSLSLFWGWLPPLVAPLPSNHCLEIVP